MSKRSIFAESALRLLSSIALLALCAGLAGAAPEDITTFAGDGTPGFVGDGGPAAAAQLNQPLGVAVDDTRNILYIGDQANNRVRQVDLTTGIITTFAGNGGPGFSNDNGLATAANVGAPSGVALDAQGNVYIASYDASRVRRVDIATNIITTVAGDGNQGFAGDSGPAVNAQLSAPSDVAVYGQNLYIADSGNNRIRKVDLTSGIITTVAGGNSAGFQDGALPGLLSLPFAVDADAQGNLYIIDSANNRLRKVDLGTNTISTVAGDGTAGFQDGALPGKLGSSHGVAVDPYGDIYIGDSSNNRLRKVDLGTNTISTVAGDGTAASSGDGGPAIAAQVHYPTGIALDAQGNVYIASYFDHRVRQIETVPAPAPISEWRAEGNADDSSGANDGVLVNGAGFAAGRVGQAFDLTGGSHVNVPSAADLNPSGSFTLSAWVFPTQDVFQPFIMKWGDSGAWVNQRAYGLWMQAGGSLVFTIADGATQGNSAFQSLSTANGIIALNAWNHIAGVYDQSTGTRRIYVNGVEVASRTDAPITILNSTADLGIGAWYQEPGIVNGSNYVQGKIDEVRLYARALSASNIQDQIFFEIAATAGANGSIAPAGTTVLNFDDSQTYTITPDAGYQISDVLVDGASVGAVGSHAFTNVQADHTISASFSSATVTISAAPAVTATYNQALTVPITLSEAAGIVAAELTVEYDTALLTLVGTASTGTLTDGWSVQTNTQAGAGTLEQLVMAMATDQSAVTGAQTLINLNFTVNDVRVPASSALTLSGGLLNDGTPPNVTVNGLVTLVGNDGSIASAPAQFIPRDDLTLTVIDLDADLDGAPGTDQVTVTATNLTTGDQVSGIVLNEDATTAGTFTGTVSTEFGTAAVADAILQAQTGEIVESSFSDALDSNGNGPIVRTAQSTAIGGADGSVAITLVSQPGDPLYIRVTDADLNTSVSTAETASVQVQNSRTAEVFTVVLTEVDVDDEVFFGNLPTTPGASTSTDMNTAEDDVVTVTYDDVVTAVGSQVDRTATDDVIDPWGDADDNESLQAFDAAQVLFDVLSGGTHLSANGRLAANVDSDPVGTGITPYDAAQILQKRVGLIASFEVQDPTSTNHPQGTPSSPKWVVETRALALASGVGYVELVADERGGVLSGDLLLQGVERVELAPAWGAYLLAARQTDEGLRVVFAGPQAVAGSGEVLRLYGADPAAMRIERAELNDGRIETRLGASTLVSRPVLTALHGNYPNPFNPETALRFDLAQGAEVRLEVFDALGQKIQTLVAEHLPAGAHQVLWRGVDARGHQVSSGVYFYRLQAGDYTQMRRMLLLK